MMIQYHKRFEKQFKKLSIRDKERVILAIETFAQNPLKLSLRNHALRGSLLGKRSIDAGPDLRIIFEEFESYSLVVFLDVGSHNRIYG